MKTVPPLEADWLVAIDRVAARVLGPHDRSGTPLATEVRMLSELYTRDRAAIRASSATRAARLRFFVARDLPKIEGPLTALFRGGRLPSKLTLSVVDLGAGYGTTTLGLARFARRVGLAERLVVRAIDDDRQALDALTAFARETRDGALRDVCVPVEVEAIEGSVAVADPSGLAHGTDLAVAGFVMNELFAPRTSEPTEVDLERRLEQLERWVGRVVSGLGDESPFVLLEPALREPTRILQTLRDRFVASTSLDVVHPCVHHAPCPLLRRERDWCHAELPIALPDALVPLAREAGLRFEGLSYATLTVKRRTTTTARELAATLVGGPIATKGKAELQLCHAGGLTRVDWMERDGAPPRALHRGALVTLDRVLEGERARQGRDVVVKSDAP